MKFSNLTLLSLTLAIIFTAVGIALYAGMRPETLLWCTTVMLFAGGIMYANCVGKATIRVRNKDMDIYHYANSNKDNNGSAIFASDVLSEITNVENFTPAKSDNAKLASAFLYEELRDNGLSPIKEEDGSIIFKYQGGYFRATHLDKEIIRIIFPRIFSISVTKQDFLCRVLNNINGSYSICRLIAMRSESDGLLEVYGYADFYYTSTLTDRFEVFAEILSVFFLQQKSLLIAAGMQEVEDIENGTFDYPDICMTSYKDLSLN